MDAHFSLVNGDSLPWVSGREVYASMEPAFRDNLGGDPERVVELLSRYWMRTLWIDPETTRRIDHVRTLPGYIDLCEAYHDSVEESYFLGGAVELTAEGAFEAGDYFWRPPGWVHMAKSPQGFECILMMEGHAPSEGSGRVSRVIRPDEEAGSNPLLEGDSLVGPRGYVRRKESRFMVWRPHDGSVTGIGGQHLLSKTLSENVQSGALTALVALPAGTDLQLQTIPRERFVISVQGELDLDGEIVTECSLLNVPAEAAAPRIRCKSDAQILVKVGARS